MANESRLKNNCKGLLKVSISAVLLAFLFQRIDLGKTIAHIQTAAWSYFLYAIIIFLIVVVLGVVRWSVLLRVLKHDVTQKRIFIAHCGGLFFNTCLPSSIGGDIARTVDLSLHTKDASSIFSTVFLDRLFGFAALVIVGFLGFVFAYRYGYVDDLRLLASIAILGVLVCGVFLVVFSRGAFIFFKKIVPFKFIKSYLEKFHTSCCLFRSHKRVLLIALVLSLLIQGGFSIVLYFIGKSLGISASPLYYFVFIPIVNTLSILPISIGGLGVRDNSAVFLFSTIGVAADRVAAMTLLNFGFLFFVGLIGGGVYGVALYSRRLQRNTKDAVS